MPDITRLNSTQSQSSKPGQCLESWVWLNDLGQVTAQLWAFIPQPEKGLSIATRPLQSPSCMVGVRSKTPLSWTACSHELLLSLLPRGRQAGISLLMGYPLPFKAAWSVA